MDADDISKLAFLLYPHLYSAPHEASSAESLASRIQELRKGLEPEDEFQAIVFWLGNCDYIFRIGVPALSSRAAHKIRSPDFLVFVKFQELEVPVLIEVKSSHKLRLDWSENYRKSLLSFASRLKLPLLVAWKCGGLWTLVDHSHFKRNVKGYRLTLKTALSEDLMCVLFRNLRLQMNPRLELRMDMEILDDAAKLSSGPNAVPKEFDAKIVEAGFFVEGHKLKRHSRHGFWLFSTCNDETEVVRTQSGIVRQTFRPKSNTTFTLSNVLLTELSMATRGESVNWHQVLTSGKFPSSGTEYRNELKNLLSMGYVKYVLDTIPQTWPAYLPPLSRKPGTDN